MKLMVCGSRTIDDEIWVHEKIEETVRENTFTDITVVEGGAVGADIFGKNWAEERGYKVMEFPAQWDKYGRSAGFRRNEDMVKVSDFVLIVWDGKSHGAFHDLCLSEKYGKPYKLYFYTNNKVYVNSAMKILSDMKSQLAAGKVSELLKEYQKRMDANFKV